MKKLQFLLVIAALFIFGCSNDVGVNGPVQQQVQTQAKKTLIQLPAGTQMMTEDQLTIGGPIDGSVGGTITDTKKIKGGGPKNECTFDVNLIVPAGAFEGLKNINVIFDNQAFAAQYTPSPMTFNKPLDLTFSVTCDASILKGVKADQIQFAYLDNQGNVLEIIPNAGVKIGPAGPGKTMLTVNNAQINHFSRYGFVD